MMALAGMGAKPTTHISARCATCAWVLGYVICGATLFLLFLWVAFDARKQGVHDKMAGTYVIVIPKKKGRVPQAQPYAAAERV